MGYLRNMDDAVVDGLEDWLKRDKESFWEHFRELERQYLEGKSDKEVSEIHEARTYKSAPTDAIGWAGEWLKKKT